MKRIAPRIVALVLLLAMIGCTALAASLDNVAALVAERGYTATEAKVKKADRLTCHYVQSSDGVDTLKWSTKKATYTVTEADPAAKLALRQLYADVAKLYKWSKASYKIDKKIQYGYKVSKAKKAFKSLGAYRKAIDAMLIEQVYGKHYVLNTNTKKFHLPACKEIRKMSPDNRVDVVAHIEDILLQGFVGCKKCNPW